MFTLVSAALAQAVSQVPPGAAAVTVLLCPEADGCQEQWADLAAHVGPLGLPLLDFDSVAAAGPAGRDRLLAWEAAMAPIRAGGAVGPDANAVSSALRALETLPFTVSQDDLFRLWLFEGAARFPSVEAERALAAAASVSGGRVTDLGPLRPDVLARYLDLAGGAKPGATLHITSDAPGRVFIDGQAAGQTDRTGLTLDVAPGWHRVSVERSGRNTAWVGVVEIPAGLTLDVEAEMAADDGSASLEASISSSIFGEAVPTATIEILRTWARANGLAWVRFVRLDKPGGTKLPEEFIPARDPQNGQWMLWATWLDVAAGRMGERGPGPAALAVMGDPGRFRLGGSLGYLHLEELNDTDFIPAHDHATVELAGWLRVVGPLAAELRLGIAHAAQRYYLDEDWLDTNVYPVSLAARLGNPRGGPYVSAGALVIVPYAVGGQVWAGWDLAPSYSWRIAPEIRAGFTDKGWLVGGEIVVTRIR